MSGQVAVVTGGAQGIGRALVHQLVNERLRAVVVFDRDIHEVSSIREEHRNASTQIVAYKGDVREANSIEQLVLYVEKKFGQIDIFCSNAGLMTNGGIDVPDAAWLQAWEVNVMAHVRAARSAIPGMLSRGGGAFLNILSAAGLLTAPGAVSYTVTKHAAMGFWEWLAIQYGRKGIEVCVVCPEAVDTQMLRESLAEDNAGVKKIAESGKILSAADVTAVAVRSLKHGDFLVTPHPHTLRNAQRKWSDIDKWIGAMGSFLAEGNE